jgi:hypothetical protein
LTFAGSVAPWHSASHDPPKALPAAWLRQPRAGFRWCVFAPPSDDSLHPALCLLLLPKFRSPSPMAAGPSNLRPFVVRLGTGKGHSSASKGLVHSVDEWIHWLRAVLPRDPFIFEGFATHGHGWGVRIHPLATFSPKSKWARHSRFTTIADEVARRNSRDR